MTLKTAFLSALALMAFAGNSVLCRLALIGGTIDPTGFTIVRLISGALALLVLIRFASSASLSMSPASILSLRRWYAPLMLFAYAALFSFAYVSLDTGTGALILFGFVQLTMVAANFLRGSRMSLIEWLGLLVACAGLVTLIFPELSKPSFSGFVMMSLSGIAWGLYTLNGQGSRNPLEDTSTNFSLSLLFVVVLAVVGFTSINLSAEGLMLAIVSGAITSGVGYSIWYAALPNLKTSQAGIMQLLVPVIAALGGVIFSNELLTSRLLIAALLILGGILVGLLAKNGDQKQ